MTPLISICLPNLNTRPYLPERFDTIFKQTYQHWELIVQDSYSDDGAWEYIQEQAARDPRIKIGQIPRGMYAAWNSCISLAKGKYIYIATSDDTMATDCLEKMVEALEAHPECDLAHCPRKTIDKDGVDQGDDWFRNSIFARSAPELVRRKHLRMAPFDGLLHLNGYYAIYGSITELLIRRTLFDKIGYFQTEFGSIADYGWNMRASLVGNTIHVPDTWAGWRCHPIQATVSVNPWDAEHQRKIGLMFDFAIETCRPYLLKSVVKGLDSGWGSYFEHLSSFNSAMEERNKSSDRLIYLLSQTLLGSPIALEYVKWRVRRKGRWDQSESDIVQSWLASVGMRSCLIDLENR